jgi:hypothetical protein
MARSLSDGRSEFAPIAIDITRARMSAFLHDEPVNQIGDAEMRAFEDYARSSDDFNQSGLVAWYYYKRKQPRDALEWFKLALQRGGDGMVAHGLAHSLRETGMKRETEEVAYAWREPLANNAILFVDILEADLTQPDPPLIEPERLSRYARVTLDTASGEGAQALAWYAYNSCQLPVALEWFQYAVACMPKEQTVFGYALTLKKLKKTKEFLEIINRYDGLFPSVVGLVFPDDAYHPPTACDLKLDPSLAKTVQSAPFNVRAAGLPAGVGYGAYPAAYGGIPRPTNQSDHSVAAKRGVAATAREDRSEGIPALGHGAKSAALRSAEHSALRDDAVACASASIDRAAHRGAAACKAACRAPRDRRRADAV